MGNTNNKKPRMPQSLPQAGGRRSGLGRGLASLIPSGDNKPSLGDGAADVILGQRQSTQRNQHNSPAAQSSDASGERSGKRDKNEKNDKNDSTIASRANSGVTGEADKRTVEASKNTAKNSSGVRAHFNRHRDVIPAGADNGGSGSKSTENPGSRGQQINDLPQEFGAEYRELPIGGIRTNAKQPRQVFEEEALNELVHSIREFGLMQPIVVRYSPDGDTDYELIMGERRLRASMKAGLESIPAIVRETDDDAMLRDALLENIHRVQLNPLEEAAAYQQLLEEFGVTQAELAQKLGRSRPLITNMIRLLQLPVPVQRRVGAGVLSAGHARALLGVRASSEIADDEAKAYVQRAQGQIADRIVAEGLSVRATEEAVTLFNRGENVRKKNSNKARQELSPEVSTWVEEISDALDTKVSVQMGKKRGKIVVEFGGPEDFDRITEILKYRR